MHARHRSPGNGYRSSSMGMGVSQEGPARGRGFYNSEYRSFRGFGRGQGQPKSFQQPPPTPRRGDIFMEAGRLAAEYLVSQGLLPPSVLSGKFQNGTFRSEDGDSMQLPAEGRSSALTRLGNSGSDLGPGRRRYPDDYNSMGLKNYLKGRKKGGSLRGYGSDWVGREYGRSSSWSERGRVSPDIEVDGDSYSGHQEEQQVGRDVGSGLPKSGSDEFTPKSEEASGLELEKYNNQDEMGSRASSSSIGKDLLHEGDGEFSKKSMDSTNMDVEAGELKDGVDETEEQDSMEDSSIKHDDLEDNSSGKNINDLLTLCKFAKVPTKTRSSLTYKGIKVEPISNNDDEKKSDIKHSVGSEALVEDGSLGSSAVNVISNKTHDSKCTGSETSKTLPVPVVEVVGDLGSVYGVEQDKFTRSQTFSDRVLMGDNEQESCQGLSSLQKSNSVVTERSEKRTMEENDAREGIKKLREWIPSMISKPDEYFKMSRMSEKKESSQEEIAAPSGRVALAVDPESSINKFQFKKGGGEPCVQYTQEKQLFPGSFKICDLNLMEASDINENHHSDPILIYPAIPEKEATPVDVDLSMSNSIMSGEFNRRNDGKEIEIIDLENDSAQVDKAAENSERKTETMFTGMEGFPNHGQNPGHIPDVQDNYDGLMITQLLNTFPDCPAVPVDINALQNEMVIHNGEGPLADDDPIYMSLGEIPLSFLRGWEQPPSQEYEKPF